MVRIGSWTIGKLRACVNLLFHRDKGSNHDAQQSWPPWVAFEPSLIPPLTLMRQEGINILEEWFRWAEEWSMLLRVYGRLAQDSTVLEIGCGLGRIAFPLRYLLSEQGSYDGFDICDYKVTFLKQCFHPAYPNFRFHWADLHNTFYNPSGRRSAAEYRFPAEDASMDLVFAASVFTHMLPDGVAHYFREAARVIKPTGHCIFSFFLLDFYRPHQLRPHGFSRPDFNFDHTYGEYGRNFAIAFPNDPERMTAYSLNFIQRMSGESGLEFELDPVPGIWSGSFKVSIGAQDLVILRKQDARVRR